jgi:hypothetical protein
MTLDTIYNEDCLQGIIDRQKYDCGFLNEMVKRFKSDLRHYSTTII